MTLGLSARIYLYALVCALLMVGSCGLVLLPPGPPPPKLPFAAQLVHLAAFELVQATRGEPPLPPLPPLPPGERSRFSVAHGPGGGLVVRGESRGPRERLHVFEGEDGPIGPGLFVTGIHEGGPGTVSMFVRGRPPVLLAVVVALALLSAASLLLARSLARPLRKLAEAARRFGAGELDTRVQLRRSDEVGQVAAAFDEMAAQVCSLLHAQRELLANVSHELRTPLARLRVGLDLAAEGDAAAAKDELAGLEDDVAALERLVGDVLAVASLDLAALRATPTSPLYREPFDLARLCRVTASRFAAGAPEHRLEVSAPGSVTLDGDATLLRRVVDNLLENARKYSEPGTTIALELARDERGAVLTVRDQGIGIDGADLPHIFTPFFRADRSRARTTGGVGLGLTLAQRIVVAHRGTIDLASRPGVGTTVTVVLPGATVDSAELHTLQ